MSVQNKSRNTYCVPGIHSYWMNRALVLARKGLGFVHPNPMVGAVVLDANGELVGEGYHEKYGEAHAEVNAFKRAGAKAHGGTLYVTLEPCSHQGKTPPCAEAVIYSGIKTVVIASQDPNPKVAGKGIEKLKNAGIDVKLGVEEDKALRLNAPFFHCIQTSKPFVRAKVAMTIDGYIGHKHQRLMISDPILEKSTMKLRAESQAVMVGSNTLRIDQPSLNVRGEYSSRKPVRIIVDSTLQTPITSKIFDHPGEVWILTSEKMKNSQQAKTIATKADVIEMPLENEKIPPKAILDMIQKRGVTSLLIEGGACLLTRFSQENLINQWIIYLNSNDLASKYKKEDLVQLSPNPLFALEIQSVIRRGQDVLIRSRP